MTTVKSSNQRGFSLIEALVAMVLLSVGLLGAGLMQIGSMKANTNAAGRTFGVGLAQSVMNDLRSRPLDYVLSATDPLDDEDGDGRAGLDDGMAVGGGNPIPANADQSMGQITASDGRDYTIFWNVADNMPMNGTKTLKLYVYWNDAKFGLNKVIMTTVLGGFYL